MTDTFGFPFEPYDIQKDFMKELYNVLSKGNVGIFESPTGTVSLLLPLVHTYKG
jgi:chromosome transmission fidelity protein 1